MLRASLLLPLLLLLTGCASVKVQHVSPNFGKFATNYATLGAEDNQDGAVAENLTEHLRENAVGLNVVDASPRFLLMAELLDNSTSTSVEHDTETREVRRRRSNGEYRTYRQVVRYETISITSRKIKILYKLEDTTSGEVIWSAEAKRSDSAKNRRSASRYYPPPPRHPDPPLFDKLANKANASVSKKLGKEVKAAMKKAAKG